MDRVIREIRKESMWDCLGSVFVQQSSKWNIDYKVVPKEKKEDLDWYPHPVDSFMDDSDGKEC